MYKIIHIASGEVCFLPNDEYMGFSTIWCKDITMASLCNHAKCSRLKCSACPWNSDNEDIDDPYFKFTLKDYKATFSIERIKYNEYIKLVGPDYDEI